MTQEEPKLAPPGAGLPFFEGLYAKYILYPKGMKDFSWQGSLDRLSTETTRIRALAEPLSDDAFFTQKLIDRLRGLEDSSRYWSVAMVLEHLVMTMRGMTQVAEMLAMGKNSNASASTAAVKPKGGRALTREQLLSSFMAASDESVKRLAQLEKSASPHEKFAHPFFGPIPAKGWVWTLGVHQALHRKQVEEILKQLK